MARVGRKPLATGHVDRLEGSERAKQRMAVILDTLRGQMTIPEACGTLGICESRFHALRHEWLQESLALLEPRQTGRPPKLTGEPAQMELEQENGKLADQLHQTQVQLEIERGMADIAIGRQSATKKTPPRGRRPRAVVGQAKPR